MFYKEWKPIYRNIAKDLDFLIDKDKKAAEVLNKLLQKKRFSSIKQLDNLIAGKEVAVFGAGPSLEPSIIKHKKELVNKFKKRILCQNHGRSQWYLKVQLKYKR